MPSIRTSLRRLTRARASRGQALIEFALVLTPLVLLVVAIVQYGLLLGANVTLTNAAREGARAGSVYLYNPSQGKDVNDQARCNAILTAVRQALGTLDPNPPHFSAGACPVRTSDTVTVGDVTIQYAQPAGVLTNDPREAYTVRVTVRYRQDIIVPFIESFLSTDPTGRFVHEATVTMVIA